MNEIIVEIKKKIARKKQPHLTTQFCVAEQPPLAGRNFSPARGSEPIYRLEGAV